MQNKGKSMTHGRFYSLSSGVGMLGAIFFWGMGDFNNAMVALGITAVLTLWAIKEKL